VTFIIIVIVISGSSNIIYLFVSDDSSRNKL